MKLIGEKVTTLGEVEFYNAVERLILQVVDMMWMEHLDAMEYLEVIGEFACVRST